MATGGSSSHSQAATDAASGEQIQQGTNAGARTRAYLDQIRGYLPGDQFDMSSMDMSGGGGGAGGSVPAAQYDLGGLRAAQDAEFARGSDQAAGIAGGALRGLTGALQARGMGGAGYEAGQIGQTVTKEANQLGELSRDQTMNAAEDNRHVADADYQGRVTQRGQDISERESIRNQQVQQAQLRLQQRSQSLQGLTAALSASAKAY